MNRVNWHQAFAEVSLLALGVGLALLADGWWEGRQERAEEAQYLTSLRSDFAASQRAFSETLARNRETRDHNLMLLELLAGDVGSVSVDSLSVLIPAAFWWTGVDPVLATYEDMVNSGDLRLIRSDSLRIEMAAFVRFIETVESLNDAALLEWKDLQAPFMVDHLAVTGAYGSYGERTFPDGRHSPDEEALWGRALENIIAIKVINLEDLIRNLDQALRQIETILHLIDAQGERRSG